MSLWEKKKSVSLILISSPLTRFFKKYQAHQGTSFCICQKASLTVEAAVVIPLMTGFLATILFFFRVLQVQAAVDEALMYAGRRVAVESSFVTSEAALFLSAETLMAVALEESPIAEEYIENGFLGISLLESDFQEKEITLKANYKMALPIAFFGIEDLSLYSQNTFRKWTGNAYFSNEEEWVYITEYGTVYHATIKCQALDLTIHEGMLSEAATLRGMNGQKYYACSRCSDVIENGCIYYTDYGSLYHGNLSCSALKRLISKVPISEVGEREQCSFCY